MYEQVQEEMFILKDQDTGKLQDKIEATCMISETLIKSLRSTRSTWQSWKKGISQHGKDGGNKRKKII